MEGALVLIVLLQNRDQMWLRIGVVACMILLQVACRKDAPPEPPSHKDPRTYTWSVDTLEHRKATRR